MLIRLPQDETNTKTTWSSGPETKNMVKQMEERKEEKKEEEVVVRLKNTHLLFLPFF